MSTQDDPGQASLSDYPSQTHQRPNWTPGNSGSTGRCCENCDHQVSARFARVFGADDGTVHRCRNCAPQADINAGLAADPSRERMEALTQ